MVMHANAREACTATVRESALKADWEKNLLPRSGIEPALPACQSNAQSTELCHNNSNNNNNLIIHLHTCFSDSTKTIEIFKKKKEKKKVLHSLIEKKERKIRRISGRKEMEETWK